MQTALWTRSRSALTTTPRKLLSYVVVAVACYLLGLVIGSGSLNPPEEAAAVKVDEAQLRAVILSVLDERDLAAAEDVAPDRFAMVDDDPYLGAEDAPVVIVEFSDFFCSYCKRHFDQTFAPLLENYGEYIRYVYRDFARLTPESGPAAEAAQCAFEQGKFWEFHAPISSPIKRRSGETSISKPPKQNMNWILKRLPPALMNGAISTRSRSTAWTANWRACAERRASSSTAKS